MARTDPPPDKRRSSAAVNFGIAAALVAVIVVVAILVWGGWAEEVESGDPEPAANVQSDTRPVDNEPDSPTMGAEQDVGVE